MGSENELIVLHAYVFSPQGWVFLGKLLEHLIAFIEVEIDHGNAVTLQKIMGTSKCAVFPSNNYWYPELHRKPGTHSARHERGKQNGILVRTQAPCRSQRIDFTMGCRIAKL